MFNPFSRNPFDLTVDDPGFAFNPQGDWPYPEGIGLGSGPQGGFFPGSLRLDTSQINDWRGNLNPAGVWAPWLRGGSYAYDPVPQRNPYYQPDLPPDSRIQPPEWIAENTSYPWGPRWDEYWQNR